MLALSLTQPWATLCVARPWSADGGETPGPAIKPIETRTWRIDPMRLPLRIAVHAAKGIDSALRHSITAYDPDDAPVHRDTRRWYVEPYRSALHVAGFSAHDPWQKGYGVGNIDEDPDGAPYEFLTLGAIVGLVTIEHICPTDAVAAQWRRGRLNDRTYRLGDFSPGRYAWMLTDAVAFDPIPATGAQGLWRVPGPIAVQVSERDDAGVQFSWHPDVRHRWPDSAR